MSEYGEMKVRIGDPQDDGFRHVTLETDRGAVETRWCESASDSAVVYIGGVGGDFDSPARDVYGRLCAELAGRGIGGLRVRFREPGHLGEATFDVLAGTTFLGETGVRRMGMVGHSFGGAVVARSAALDDRVKTLVLLSTQSYGADPIAHLPGEASTLLIHGGDDGVLPPSASEHVYALAHEPKRLVILPGAGHVLDEVEAEVEAEVRTWLLRELLAE